VKLSFDRRLLLLALAAGLPAVALAAVFVWRSEIVWPVRVAAILAVAAAWGGGAIFVRRQVVHPLQTISNLLAALREDDFSIRARGAEPGDPLGQVMLEVNTLADTLRVQRLGAQEATALLRAVMAEIDVAIFAFDHEQRLVLVNRFGERLLGQSGEELIGQLAPALGLSGALSTSGGLQDLTFPGGKGRWEVRRTSFWQGGLPHELLVLTDLSQPLREQEREAWRRLIRVLGHELNNSLAPIKSIAGSLESLLGRMPPPEDWREDMQRGLGVVASRADALSRFIGEYARLARLPPPSRRSVELGPLARRVVALEERLPVAMSAGPDVTLNADPDQLEQLLINVVRNAVDAARETRGCVALGWRVSAGSVEIWVEDEGPGLQNTSNLFVPFFTTKPGGSGIGLAISRQIAEAHNGTLALENRQDRTGTRATLRLPRSA
jgi:nitrogen fixation/metabolism regulation signal transduction histidine kinase